MNTNKKGADGKFILVQDGQRLDGEPLDSQEQALAEAAKQQSIQESKGRTSPVQVKKILNG
jgi:hypothetical protein